MLDVASKRGVVPCMMSEEAHLVMIELSMCCGHKPRLYGTYSFPLGGCGHLFVLTTMMMKPLP